MKKTGSIDIWLQDNGKLIALPSVFVKQDKGFSILLQQTASSLTKKLNGGKR